MTMSFPGLVAIVDRADPRGGRQQAANVGERKGRLEPVGLREGSLGRVALACPEGVEHRGGRHETLRLLRDMGADRRRLCRK